MNITNNVPCSTATISISPKFFGNPLSNPLSRLGAEDRVTVDKHYERQWGACQADLAQAEHDRDLLKGAARSNSWPDAISFGVVMGALTFVALFTIYKLWQWKEPRP